MARTKTEVKDKLKELHTQAENGVWPRRNYTVNDALDDWLATGLDGLAPSTVKLYRNTIAKALREELGAVEMTKLSASATVAVGGPAVLSLLSEPLATPSAAHIAAGS